MKSLYRKNNQFLPSNYANKGRMTEFGNHVDTIKEQSNLGLPSLFVRKFIDRMTTSADPDQTAPTGISLAVNISIQFYQLLMKF